MPGPPAWTSTSARCPGAIKKLLQLLLQGAELDAVVGDDVQPVLVELQQHVVLILRADQAPTLHLPWPHVDHRPPLAVDRQEARRRFRKERAEVLDHGEGVEHHLRQQHDPLARPGDSGTSAKSPSTMIAPTMPLATCTSAEPW